MKTRIQEIHEQTEQEVYSHLQIQHSGVVLHSQIQTINIYILRVLPILDQKLLLIAQYK